MSKVPVVSTELLDHALRRTQDVLDDPDVAGQVAKYYRVESDYAGSLYLGIPDPDPTTITVADLFAVTSLSIKIPARAARRLLLEPGGAEGVTQALRALPKTSLVDTDDKDLQLMEDFYVKVKGALTRAGARKPSGAWVTASKIVARKRPDLFPVRDTKVTTLLGTRGVADYLTDWIVYRHLMSDDAVVTGLQRIAAALDQLAGTDEYLVETAPLRLLDVALWTHPGTGP